MKLSICIPTYNRASYLANCLHSIRIAAQQFTDKFEICISDNASTDETQRIVSDAALSLPIRYHCHEDNLGIPRNFLHVVSMASGDFVWLVGDDDLLLPDTLRRLFSLIDKYQDVDFFYVNAFHLSTEYVMSRLQPFDTHQLPKNMERVSKLEKPGELPFLKLIHPAVSFDFLGGMFLSVFRRTHWLKHCHQLDARAICDPRMFSHFDNTFPHLKIHAKAFSNSKAYFNDEPMIVCLSGARSWSPLNPLVQSVRLVEALKVYKSEGLSWFRYMQCRNFALRSFVPDIMRMILNQKQSGWAYVNIRKHVLSNLMFPYVYYSPINYLKKKIFTSRKG